MTIPEPLYRRAEELARKRQVALSDVLAQAIALAEAAEEEKLAADACMAREEAAYRAMHKELESKYAGEYVAIFQGELIDHDPDELALLQRLDTYYPDEVVLMRQVLPLPEKPLHARSPRWVPGDVA